MKKLLFVFTLLSIATLSTGQNVGIGEPAPAAKLTIKGSDGLNRNLLIKTNTDDTAMYISGYRHYMNGYSNTTNTTLTVNNKYFLPFDQPQLVLLSSGEFSGINANGGYSQMDFSNINNMNARFNISSYTGNASFHRFGIAYYNFSTSNFQTLLSFRDNGNAGFGTTTPAARVQINHRATPTVPTLGLFDSSTTTGPTLQFRNTGGTENWQIRTTLHNATDRMDFVHDNLLMASLNNNGNVGIGISNPQYRLQLYNNTGTQITYAQFTNPTTGSGPSDGLLTGINGIGHAFIYNQEVANLYFGTSNTTRMMIESGGKVGIGVDPPTETLDVGGNINSSGLVRVTGEVNRPATGAAHLLPIAYGNISLTGFVQSGSGNISVTRLGVGFYAVTITGEAYQFQTYTTVVTPAGNLGAILTNTGSGSGNLHIYTYNTAGLAV